MFSELFESPTYCFWTDVIDRAFNACLADVSMEDNEKEPMPNAVEKQGQYPKSILKTSASKKKNASGSSKTLKSAKPPRNAITLKPLKLKHRMIDEPDYKEVDDGED